VRLLIGTRRHLVERLAGPNQILDLDASPYLVADDLVRYVHRCLLLEADPEIPTPYRDKPELASQVAEAVAERAGGSFLVAQLAALGAC
jgi:hypothetical protein